MSALLKKQMMEVFSWFYQSRKTGERRSKVSLVGYALLYLFLFGYLAVIFYFAATALCAPLVEVGMGWLYFAIMGLLALLFGVFGSVFNTYSSLYKAKDNDLLLAMPIPPVQILTVRLSGVYAMGLMYQLLVMIPTLIVWFQTAPIGPAGVVCSLLIPFALSVLALVFSALLGWVVALVSERLKRKNLVVVLVSLAVFALYYYFCGNIYSIAQTILANPQEFGGTVRGVLYPLYHMGLAAEGNLLSMVLFTAIVAALFALAFWALSHNFLKIVTSNRGEGKTKYREEQASLRPVDAAVRSVNAALLHKELRRFLGSAAYMLNCGLGAVFMLVAAAALVWKGGMVRELLQTVFAGYQETAFLASAAVVCLLAAMNDLTAPSVSLEGSTLWLSQSLPVSGRQALMAKLKLHLLLTWIPAAVLTAAVEWVIRPSMGFAVLIPVAVALFVLVMAQFGLLLGVKRPNLHWTSEVVPIKQSLPVMLTLFGGWALIGVLIAAYALLSGILPPVAYLGLVTALLLALSAALHRWLTTKGAARFEGLS